MSAKRTSKPTAENKPQTTGRQPTARGAETANLPEAVAPASMPEQPQARRRAARGTRSHDTEQMALPAPPAAKAEHRKAIELADELGYAYREYAHYTLLDRAIADVRDGCKPVHRRIIYAMGDMSLWPTTQHRKSARVVGEVLGKYHPHSDQAVYDALARMAQDFSLRDVLVDGQGNFGSIDGDAPAAMRYTEVRLSQIGTEMLRDIDMETVDWQDNFDNSLKEPNVLPAAFPNVLVNGSSGIAVGFAANLPPHNLAEVCDGVVLMCGRWKQRARITVDDLMTAIPGPDFPTGGLVFRYRTDRAGKADGEASAEVRSDAIKTAYETGSAGIICQARMDVEKGSGRGGDQIVITEIPYGLQKSTIIQRIASEAREGKITGVTDIVDESDRQGMRVVVQISRQAAAEDVMEMLVRRSALRTTFGVNNLVLAPKQADETGEARIVEPKILGLKEILEQFVLHRLEIIQRRSRYELERRRARLHIVEGLLIALDHIDEVIETIRRSQTADTARTNLMRKFRLTEIQATAILDMQLRRLAAMERTKLKDEEKELKARIDYLEKLLASEARQLEVIKQETTEIKQKYATPRRTTIIDTAPGESGAIVTTSALAVPDRPQIVAVTTVGVQRCNETDYAYKIKAGASSRAVTAHRMRVRAEPADRVFLVATNGSVWIAPVGQVPAEAALSALGLKDGENIVYAGALPESSAGTEPQYLVLGTAGGKVKRIELRPLLEGIAQSTWTEAIGLGEQDRVLFAGVCAEKGQVLFLTSSKVLRTAATEIGSQQTPSARGMIGVKLEADDRLLGGAVCTDPKNWIVLILTEKGFIKQMSLGDFSQQGRGGKGVQSLSPTRTTGGIVAAAAGGAVKSGSVDVLAADGKRQRISLADIPLEKRTGRGKKLVELANAIELVIWE